MADDDDVNLVRDIHWTPPSDEDQPGMDDMQPTMDALEAWHKQWSADDLYRAYGERRFADIEEARANGQFRDLLS